MLSRKLYPKSTRKGTTGEPPPPGLFADAPLTAHQLKLTLPPAATVTSISPTGNPLNAAFVRKIQVIALSVGL